MIMKDFLLVFKTLYKNNRASRFVEKNGKKRLSNASSMLLSLCILALLFCGILGIAASSLKDSESFFALVGSVVFAAQMFILFTTVFSVINTLYSSYDNAFLAALPLRPSAVFFAKFTLVYVNALKMSFALLVPTLLTISITYAVVGNPLFAGFYPLVLLIALSTPLLPLFVVVLLSMPIIWVSSFLKGRSILKSVLMIAFYILVMSGYLAVVMFLSLKGGDFGISSGAAAGLSAFSNAVYPNAVLIRFCMGIDAGKNFGIWLGIAAGIILATILLGMLFFRRVSMKNTESALEKNRGNIRFKRQGIVASLMKKDYMSVLRNPPMALGCFANIILSPVFIIIFYFVFNFEPSVAEDINAGYMQIGMLLLYTNIFLSGANAFAMQAYTREGESFFISKALPIRAQDSITAKFLIAFLTPMICLIAVLPISVFLYKIDVVSSLLACTVIMLTNLGVSGIYIYHDIKEGNQHWKTQSDLRAVSQGNFFSLIPITISVLPGVAFIIFGAVSDFLNSVMGKIGAFALIWAATLLICVPVAGVGLYLLFEKGVPLYDEIGEKTAEINKRPRINRFGGKGDMLN